MAVTNVVTIMPHPAPSIEELRRIRAVLLAIERDPDLDVALDDVEAALIDEIRRRRGAER